MREEPGGLWPHYTSTACLHENHTLCRLQCKYCDAHCRCSCHKGWDVQVAQQQPQH